MKHSLKLKEQRASLVEELQKIVDLAEAEERDFNTEEEARQGEIHAEVNTLDEKIVQAEKTEEVLLRNVAEVAAPAAAEKKEVEKIRGRFSISKAISDIVNKGHLDGIEAEMSQEGRRELSAMGKTTRGNLTLPAMLVEGRANEPYGVSSSPGNSVTLQGQSGIVGTDVAAMVEGLRPVPVLERMGATRIQAQGDVVLPSLPNEAATETNEGATVNNIDGDFQTVTLSPKRFAMRMDLSRQLLVQSAANLDSVIQADMANAIANKLDEDMIDDIFTQLATAGNITDGSTGSGTSATATDYLDLTNHEGGFLSQNPSGQNLAMLMDPTMASFLKQVSQSSGGAILNSGNEILGYPVFTSTNATTKTVVADTYFSGITDTDDTLVVRPIYFLDPADIFYAVFGQLDVTIDPYTSAHTGVVRLIADYYADGAIRRTGSGRILAGLTANTTPTTV